VYYVEDDGEIINDVLKIPVQLVFKNKVRFKVMMFKRELY
jgi:CD109 antigen